MKETEHDLLLRIDERTKKFEEEFLDIKCEIKRIRNCYVSKTEFSPVKKLTFGAVAVILTIVLSGLVYLTIVH